MAKRVYDRVKMNKSSILKEIRQIMQGKPVIPQFGDFLNKVGEIKLIQKFSPKAVHAMTERKNKEIPKQKKKAVDLLIDKLVYRQSNSALKKKFGVNDNFISNRLKYLKKGKLDPEVLVI